MFRFRGTSVVLSFMHSNNETGALLPIKEIITNMLIILIILLIMVMIQLIPPIMIVLVIIIIIIIIIIMIKGDRGRGPRVGQGGAGQDLVLPLRCLPEPREAGRRRGRPRCGPR